MSLRQSKAAKRPNPEISDLTALKIMQAKINPTRPATDLDWEKIERLTKGDVSDAPRGAFTTRQYADKFKTSHNRAERALQKQVDLGTMETGLFLGSLNGYRVRHWWLKK